MLLIYPGSFDPVTEGHISIIRRAAEFASVIVAVLDNPTKSTLFTTQERLGFLKDTLQVEVDCFSGLLAEYAVQKDADALLRGLRNPSEFTSENKYAMYNSAISATLGKRIETIFLPALPELAHVSSTIIKEAAAHIYKSGLNDSFIAEHVPPTVRAALKKQYSVM
ncbi:MAG: pantetheine-phosphate adenylyltransferase [Defluviitaleaceae bacterium]|nr:pantetheine-phosphate adenylyltransferase [Defluviitaleaceae bacterium]